MASPIQQQLSATVQDLLNRFYSSQTNNEEKKAIELQLQQLQTTSFNWHTCLGYMSTIENSYLWFFAATTVERTASLMWKHLNSYEQSELRIRLFDLFVKYPPDMPAMQRDKVAKIMATIARQQCITNEQYFQEFEKLALDLLDSKFFLGLALVAAIGDTVTSTESTQATNFTNVVNRYTPSIMQALNKYSNVFVTVVRDENNPATFDGMSGDMKDKCCTQLLNIIQQYFSWMKLEQVEAMMVCTISFIACSWNMLRDGAIGALGALTELLYRNETLKQDAGIQLANGVNHIIAQDKINMADELYQEKVCDLVRQYIKRGWPYEQGGKSRMLHQLLEFTLCAKTPHMLMERINIWTYVCGSRYAEDADNEQCLVGTELSPEFAKRLMNFLTTTLFFRTYPELELLDNVELDENSDTEMTRYQNQSIDLVSQLFRFLNEPMQEQAMLSLLANDTSNPYSDGNIFFRGMVQAVHNNPHLLNRFEGERTTRICMVDYITACNLVIELATMMYGKYPRVDYALQQTIIGQIQLFCQLSDVLQPVVAMFTRMISFNRYIFSAFARFILQLKLCLQISSSTQSNGGQIQCGTRKLADILSNEQKMLLITKLPAYVMLETNSDPATWSRVIITTMKLLNMYMTEKLLGPKTTCTMIFNVLKDSIMSSKLLHLEQTSRSLVYRTVCTCMLMLHDEIGENTAEISPAYVLEQYICFIAGTVFKLMPSEWEQLHIDHRKQLIDVVGNELQHLNDIMAFYATETGIMRSRLARAMYRVTERVLMLFRSSLAVGSWTTTDSPSGWIVNVLLEFCKHSATLQIRQDSHLLKEVVQLLKELFLAEEMHGMHRLRSAQTMLDTFGPLVSDPYNRSLVPDIIHVLIDELLPVIASDERYTEKDELLRYEDVLNRLFQLLHDVLHHHWQYFVETNPAALSDQKYRAIVQPEQFLTIMNAYGYALLNHSGYQSVVGTVLNSLDTLQSRRNLYRLQLFTDQLLDHFIKSLLTLAISDIGNIHLERTIKMLYDMADINSTKLKVIICDLGMTHDLNTFHMLQSATDLHSFQMVLSKIINEAKAQPPVCKNLEFFD
uniref:Importin N-terminal domain-containing protein n=1 Tax=Anopheles culicifacies TaxID=139723 RepID=A0A182M0F7_9DIPT